MEQNRRNYSKEQDRILQEIEETGKKPTLLLHSCCAPCSSYVMEHLTRYFSIFILYYNPNIEPESEYEKRRAELQRLIASMPLQNEVTLLPCEYDNQAFREISKGLEDVPEGGERCLACFRLRLQRAAEEAKKRGFDYFTTSLSISPLKNAEALNRIGEEIGKELGVAHLPSDFKKKEGYKRSLELSREYDLYRQDYCGCVFSKAQRVAAQRNREKSAKEEAVCR